MSRRARHPFPLPIRLHPTLRTDGESAQDLAVALLFTPKLSGSDDRLGHTSSP